jgi:hypothetical protein
MRNGFRRSAAPALLFLWATLPVRACNLPVPFEYVFENQATATLSAASEDLPCTVVASFSPSPGPVAAAFLHYARPKPLASVRYGFRIDTSALTNLTLANRAIQLFSASSPSIVSSASQLLHVWLSGGSSAPTLHFAGVRADGAPVPNAVTLTQALNTVRFEINVGAGTAGNVRYWINAAYSDPPTGILDNGGAGLDNAAWLGVIAAEFGVSSPSDKFREFSGGTVTYDQIESNDDLLFWHGFDTGAQ